MKVNNIIKKAAFLSVALAALMAGACNTKGSSSDEPYPTDSSSTALTGFSLKANSSVASDLDSVFFSIDLNRGLIFNADSLPMGADVSKLVPVITYSSSISAIQIEMTGGSVREGTVDYITSPTDSIDFTGRVLLKVTAADGVNSRTYDVHVNVHRMNPDSLVWSKNATGTLPARLASPRQQRTVLFAGRIRSIIEEADGSYTLASTSADKSEAWTKETFSPGFTPDVRSLTATDDALCILDTDGNLHTSADGLLWTDAAQKWNAILGGYGDLLLGLREDNGTLLHTCWPAGSLPETAVPARFPVSGFSNMVCITSKWTTAPTAILVGGRLADGSLTDATWAFDGLSWARIDVTAPAPVADATIVPYFMYRYTSTLWLPSEHSVFMLLGGTGADGKPTRNTYYTLNNGVIWSPAAEQAALPSFIPPFSAADALVLSSPMSGSLTDFWTEAAARPARISYAVDGYDISWECPYIYLFGGIGTDGLLLDSIRRGVLARLTFMPLV